MRNFADQLRQHLQPTFARCLETPYVEGLQHSTLPEITHQQFLRHDILFLTEVAKLIQLHYEQAVEPFKTILSGYLYGMLREKNRLMLQCFGNITCDSLPEPWLAYIDFLRSQPQGPMPGLFLVSLMPCSLLYNHIAKQIIEFNDPSHDYLAWARSTYSTTRQNKIGYHLQIVLNAGISEQQILTVASIAANYELELFIHAFHPTLATVYSTPKPLVSQ